LRTPDNSPQPLAEVKWIWRGVALTLLLGASPTQATEERVTVPTPASPSTAPATPAPTTVTPASNAGEQDLNLEDLPEQTPTKPTLSVGDSHAGAAVMGRFDVVYELRNPGLPYPTSQNVLTSYHNFVFVKAHAGNVSFLGEATRLLFYEGTVKLQPWLSVTAGKIQVPFGAPGFHRYYGGVQGDPLTGIFLPVIWAEYGAAVEAQAYHQGELGVDATVYAVRGFGAGTDRLPATNSPASGNDRLALGGRIALSHGKFHGWISGYLRDRWGGEGILSLYGFDFASDWGAIPLPVLKDFRVLAGLARTDFTLLTGSALYRYGDYLQVEWRSPVSAVIRGRYGTYIHDSRVASQRDLHNWNLSVLMPLPYGLSALAEYQWNMEEVNEVDNDVFRLQLAIDF